ncbi:MAG: polyphenol oxidase family protein [Mycobacteriales bacterium]
MSLAFRSFPFDGLTAVVTTRYGGVSEGPYATLNLADHVGDEPGAVRENRDRVAAALGVESLTGMDQQHTAHVHVVTAAEAGTGHHGGGFPATDALVTDVPGIALTVVVADCRPVVLWDAGHCAVGVAHCGRNGILGGIVDATLAAMRERFGSTEVVAGIGPGIAGCSYEVGADEIRAFDAAFPDVPGLLAPTRPGHARLDLLAALRHQLRDIPTQVLPGDTYTDPDLFSHRRERPCGRFALVAVIDQRAPAPGPGLRHTSR